MKDSTQRKKVLEEMLESKNFDQLDFFHDSSQWEEMPTEERELLGLLYVLQGEKQLSKGDNKVLDSFKLANLVAPNCPRIMYRQAIAFARETHNIYCLKAAKKIFHRVISIESEFFEAWHGLANACVVLAIHSNGEEDFRQAQLAFLKAEELLASQSKECQAALYRDWGVLWFHSGKYSGEALDFRNSINCYKNSISLGMKTHDLWNDFGNCLTELAALLKKPELILESVNMYWRAVRLKDDFFEGWMNMAAALKVIYEIQPLEAYYKLANEGFEKASRLEPQSSQLWIKWGQLQVFHGKTFKSLDALSDSIRKFEAASICEPDHPAVLCSWAESLLTIGEWTEDLQLLREAEEKVVKSLEKQKDQPRIWYLYGNCLAEIGRYFEDAEPLFLAVEKFQFGLRLSPNDPVLWNGLAMVYLSLSQTLQEMSWLEKANDCCRQSIENGGHGQAQYWNDWGVVLMKSGTAADDKELVSSALNRFEQALRIRSQFQKHQDLEPEWLYNYGCALDFLGDFEDDLSMLEKAVQVLKKVVDVDPTFHHAYYNLAIALAHYGDLTSEPEAFRESLNYLEAYVCLEVEDEHAWNEWGLTLIDLSQLIDDPVRKTEAEQLLREAEVKFQHAGSLGSQTALYHLACLHCLKRNYGVAIHYLQKAKEAGALPPIEDLVTNHWLEPIRYSSEFQRIILD